MAKQEPKEIPALTDVCIILLFEDCSGVSDIYAPPLVNAMRSVLLPQDGYCI